MVERLVQAQRQRGLQDIEESNVRAPDRQQAYNLVNDDPDPEERENQFNGIDILGGRNRPEGQSDMTEDERIAEQK